jgi:nitrogen fixation NifU-like protein
MYNETVMDHFKNPRNVGEIADADGVGEVGNPACGDIMAFYIKVQDDRLSDVKFKTFGCGAAIAVSSMVSEMAMGKTLDEAMKITNKSVLDALEGLPKKKHHCSNLGADALHRAIEDYRAKQKGNEFEKPVDGPEVCSCPVCDVNDPEEAPYCQSACARTGK